MVWLAFFPLQVFKMRRSAITWLAKDHWPFVACPSFPWRWSDCFSLRGLWLSFLLISSVSSSPITQTPTDGGNEAEDTGYLDNYWIILWLKFQTSETWSDFWNMKHALIALWNLWLPQNLTPPPMEGAGCRGHPHKHGCGRAAGSPAFFVAASAPSCWKSVLCPVYVCIFCLAPTFLFILPVVSTVLYKAKWSSKILNRNRRKWVIRKRGGGIWGNSMCVCVLHLAERKKKMSPRIFATCSEHLQTWSLQVQPETADHTSWILQTT